MDTRKRVLIVADAAYLHRTLADMGREQGNRGPIKIDWTRLSDTLEFLVEGAVYERWYLNSGAETHFHTTLKLANWRVQLHGFKNKNVQCRHCRKDHDVQVQKGVDVGIATIILKHCLRNLFDTLVLIAGDGDFLEVLKTVRDECAKEVYVVGANDRSISPDLVSMAKVIRLETILDEIRAGVERPSHSIVTPSSAISGAPSSSASASISPILRPQSYPSRPIHSRPPTPPDAILPPPALLPFPVPAMLPSSVFIPGIQPQQLRPQHEQYMQQMELQRQKQAAAPPPPMNPHFTAIAQKKQDIPAHHHHHLHEELEEEEDQDLEWEPYDPSAFDFEDIEPPKKEEERLVVPPPFVPQDDDDDDDSLDGADVIDLVQQELEEERLVQHSYDVHVLKNLKELSGADLKAVVSAMDATSGDAELAAIILLS